jgi:hypothetical protein
MTDRRVRLAAAITDTSPEELISAIMVEYQDEAVLTIASALKRDRGVADATGAQSQLATALSAASESICRELREITCQLKRYNDYRR